MYAVALLTELMHRLLSPLIPFEPFLTRAEVCKVGVSHFMSLRASEADLRYAPLVTGTEGMRRARNCFAPLVHTPSGRPLALIIVLIIMYVSMLLLACIPRAN